MWERVLRDSLPAIRSAVPPRSNVLEVGYGDGLLSCYMAAELGWRITGLDINPLAAATARDAASRFGLADRLDLRLMPPDQTRQYEGRYQAVFVKTVFYSASTLAEYREWLDWVSRVLEPRGVLVNYETGRANSLTQAYRRLRRRPYTGLCLYTAEIESLYDTLFDVSFRRYYGGLSQFLAPLPVIYEAGAFLENMITPRRADNCFAVAAVLRKK